MGRRATISNRLKRELCAYLVAICGPLVDAEPQVTTEDPPAEEGWAGVVFKVCVPEQQVRFLVGTSGRNAGAIRRLLRARLRKTGSKCAVDMRVRGL